MTRVPVGAIHEMLAMVQAIIRRYDEAVKAVRRHGRVLSDQPAGDAVVTVGDTLVCAAGAGGRPRTPPGNRGVAMGMTQQYLAGELSIILARLPAAATTKAWASQAGYLRHEAETKPLTAGLLDEA